MSDSTVSALAAAAWDTVEAAHPLHATAIGDRRFDDRLPPIDRAAVDSLIIELEALLARAGTIETAALTRDDRLTVAAVSDILRAERDASAADVWRWTVDPVEGPQVELLNVPSYHEVRNAAEADALVGRWAAMGPWLDHHTENVRTASREGLVSPATPVRHVIATLDELLARPIDDWPLMTPARRPVPGLSAVAATRLADAVEHAVRSGVRPALERHRSVLVEEILPIARSDDRPGLVHVPGGAASYERLVRAHTSLDLSPERIHQIGLDEVARIDQELASLGSMVLVAPTLADVQQRLRSDPALHFAAANEVFDTAARSLARAQEAIPEWFGRLPRAGCEVVAIPSHEAEHSTIAYYREPAADGSRPGQYYINTSHAGTRPRYEAEVLAFHESVPGHHLQLAIAQELDHLPPLRRHAGSTAYIEGWGLYTERLADEMGLYSGDLDHLGILSFDGWRACRLVVDTGMHALGWSRQQAIDYMLEHTALAANNVVNEVDRYISWPGQALAYKLGQLELLRLRAEGARALGPGFDLRRFHDAVLGEGALPLGALREHLEAWVASGG